jgi:thiol-disulfide isomerase/thioredoxin
MKLKNKLFVFCAVFLLAAGMTRAQTSSGGGVDSVQKKLAEQKRADEIVIFNEKSADEMEKKYVEWIKKYPQAKFPADTLTYDYTRAAIAMTYAKEKNRDKAVYYIDQLQMEFWKGNGFGGIADIFYKNGDLKDAELYKKKAIASAGLFIDGKRGDDNKAKFAASGYGGLNRSYARMLYEDKRYGEALVYIQQAFAYEPKLKPDVNYLYARILMTLDRNQEAFDKLEAVLRAGKASPEMEADLKKLYVTLKGSDKGYADYVAAIHKSSLTDLGARLTKEMISEPAADFTLRDVNGKAVSLAELKGKVVVLDFWATWCGPCKGSFPAMQMAVNKYRDDSNVKFLFIHTFEKDENATKLAKNYVDSMKYSFEVLMDLKDPATKTNVVSAGYKVNAIPTKFVIDKQGNIRFKLTGFDGSKEAAVDELSMMIEMAKS